jgi:dimeric dUTPase (all-alpha-NTP-PPase superfamily)
MKGGHGMKTGLNLAPLFDMQEALDNHIRRKQNIPADADLVPDLKDALDVEIAELQNEVRYFKFWSTDRNMRRDKALMEYADGMHFFLSLGLAFEIPREFEPIPHYYADIRKQFRALKRHIYIMEGPMQWYIAFNLFLGLGELLGFSWSEIIRAYAEKNKINHERQEVGY